MTQRVARGFGRWTLAVGALGLAGCVQAPGPVEQQLAIAEANCRQGSAEECQRQELIQPFLVYEQSRQVQENSRIPGYIIGGVVGWALYGPLGTVHFVRAAQATPLYYRHRVHSPPNPLAP